MSAVHNPPLVDPRVHSRLRRLGADLRLRLAFGGLGWVLAALLLAAWVSLVVDYGLYRLTKEHLPLAPRLLLDGLCLAGVAMIVWKRLLRSLLRGFTEADLAALVERGYPQLEDRLLSAVYFQRGQGGMPGASEELVRHVAGEANQAALGLRFSSILRSRPVWSILGIASALLVLTGALAWAAGDVAAPWAARNLLWREAVYPKQTILLVSADDPIRVVRGDPLTITVTAEAASVAPQQVTFHMRFPSLGQSAETVPASGPDQRTYAKTLSMVNEPLTFYVTGNDDRTGEFRVELVEPPDLSDLEIEVRSPPYTRRPPRTVRRGATTIDVPEEGVVALSGMATKDLAEARTWLDQEPAGSCRIQTGGRQSPRRFEAQLLVRAPKPYRPCLNLRIALRDTEGIENPKAASCNLTLRQDQPPTAHLEAVKMGGDITSQAAIPLLVAAK
ncbi:MAG: hypothetical protein ABR915_11680, partial [Thermoguttaceae bacterium]